MQIKNILFSACFLIRNYRTSTKNSLKLTKDLDEVIIGCMLGDLSAEKPSSRHNTRLQFKQSVIHQAYIDHLWSLFKTYCGSKPLNLSRFDDRPGKLKTYWAIKFQTLSLDCFNVYRKLFYNSNGIKIVPINLELLLTARGLAYWFMDDGYSLEDNKNLANILNKKFNLQASVHKVTNGYRLYIPSSTKGKFLLLIKPYLIPHFLYKIDI